MDTQPTYQNPDEKASEDATRAEQERQTEHVERTTVTEPIGQETDAREGERPVTMDAQTVTTDDRGAQGPEPRDQNDKPGD